MSISSEITRISREVGDQTDLIAQIEAALAGKRGGSTEIVPLTATENGVYQAETGQAYSPVTVAVPQPSGSINIAENGTHDVSDYASAVVNVPQQKNIQYYAGMQSKAANSLSSTGVKLTVAKTGNYKISWMAARGSSSGTMSTRLYVNNQAKDTDRTTWTQTYGQQITINSFALTQGQTVEIYARSGSTSRQVMVGQLVIEEL